jgi:hypothetical protein
MKAQAQDSVFPLHCSRISGIYRGFQTNERGYTMGSVIKKRRKKIRKHKHRKLLKRTRHQRR